MPAARPASAACSKAGLKSAAVFRSDTYVIWACRCAWLLHPHFKTGLLPEFATFIQLPTLGLCNAHGVSLHDPAGSSSLLFVIWPTTVKTQDCRMDQKATLLQLLGRGGRGQQSEPCSGRLACTACTLQKDLKCWNLNYGCGDSWEICRKTFR